MTTSTSRWKVAFVCIKNSCRSQMAEAFARAFASDVIDARSGGTAPSSVVDPLAVAVTAEIGIDISGAVPKLLTVEDTKDLDFVVHMGCGSENTCLSVPGVPSENWGIEDPSGHGLERYRDIRSVIKTKVLDLARRLREGDMPSERAPLKFKI